MELANISADDMQPNPRGKYPETFLNREEFILHESGGKLFTQANGGLISFPLLPKSEWRGPPGRFRVLHGTILLNGEHIPIRELIYHPKRDKGYFEIAKRVTFKMNRGPDPQHTEVKICSLGRLRSNLDSQHGGRTGVHKSG